MFNIYEGDYGMSVRKNEQSVSRFNTLDIILKLVSYTCNILANEKIFIPRYQKFIDKMAEETCLIYHKCRVANKIDMRVDEGLLFEQRATQRLNLEREALVLCEDLHSDIMISQKLFHLKASRVRYWTKLTVEAQNAIGAWYKSEIKRYRP